MFFEIIGRLIFRFFKWICPYAWIIITNIVVENHTENMTEDEKEEFLSNVPERYGGNMSEEKEAELLNSKDYEEDD